MDRKVVHIRDSPGTEVYTIDDFLTKTDADELLVLTTDPTFPLATEPKVIVYGKEGKAMRRVGFFSDDSVGYKFAGVLTPALAHTPETRRLQDKINEALGVTSNGVLINHYRDGSDSIGAHSDDERTLCSGLVAAISVGSARTFRIHDKKTGKKLVDIQTGHGQLLVMSGQSQSVWKHSVPARKKVKEPRVSFTFRTHVPDRQDH